MPSLTPEVSYTHTNGLGPKRCVDHVATAARRAAEAIQGLEGIRAAFPDADDAGALKDAQATAIEAFSRLLAAIWKEAADHNLINNLNGAANEAPEAAEIADWITDNAPHIDPDKADGGRDDALNLAIDMRRGK
jgi:hypothetical protein